MDFDSNEETSDFAQTDIEKDFDEEWKKLENEFAEIEKQSAELDKALQEFDEAIKMDEAKREKSPERIEIAKQILEEISKYGSDQELFDALEKSENEKGD